MAVEALKKILNNLEENGKKLTVSDVTYSDPKEAGNDFYSAFSTFKIKSDVQSLFSFVLDYAPSSTEVLATKDVKISAADFQAVLNDISGRLNQMDHDIKLFSSQNLILTRQNEELKKKLGERK